MTIKKLLVPAIALLILIFFALGYDASRTKPPVIGASAPELQLAFYDGYEWNNETNAKLSDFRGKIVVLNFWASWCIPCVREAPLLEQTARDYANDDVVLLGVAWSDTDKKALEFLAEYQITYPNAPDLGLEAKDIYQFVSVPETFFINKDGTIHYHHAGEISEQMMAQILEQMMQ